MKTIKFITKLATVWLLGIFAEGLVTFGSVFAIPMSEWGVFTWLAQSCYMISLVGIAIWWNEEQD